MTTDQTKANRAQLYVLLGLPVGIVLLSTLVFFTGLGLPSGTSNYGELVDPPRALADYGITFDAPPPNGRKSVWTLLQVAPEGCDQKCIEDLTYSRQLRTALGKRTPGLARLLWASNVGSAVKIEQEHPDLKVQNLPATKVVEDLFAGIDTTEVRYYLVDPRGFVMMLYRNDQNYKGMIGDLKFLLKQSGY